MAHLPEGWIVGCDQPFAADGIMDPKSMTFKTGLGPKSMTFAMELGEETIQQMVLDQILELQKKLAYPPVPESLRPNRAIARIARMHDQSEAQSIIEIVDSHGYRITAPEGSLLIRIHDGSIPRFVIRRPDRELVMVPGVLEVETLNDYEQSSGATWVENPMELPAPPESVGKVRLVCHSVTVLADALGVQVYTPAPSVGLTGYVAPSQQDRNRQLVDQMLSLIPGARAEIKNPSVCTQSCPGGHSIRTMVIHLNDYHRWTYQQIADWLDTLDVDLTIHTKEDRP